MYKPL